MAGAFFEGKVQRDVCVELPPGAMTAEDRNKDLSRKVETLYGARDAAANWQEEVAKEMQRWGLKGGKYNPCLHYNEKTGLEVLVHGDDFVSVGSRDAAYDLKKKLESRFEITTQILGRGGGEEENRIVRATEEGWEYEADQRHVEIILADLGLAEANPVNAPSEDEKAWEKEEHEKEMTGDRATRYRAIAVQTKLFGH